MDRTFFYLLRLKNKGIPIGIVREMLPRRSSSNDAADAAHRRSTGVWPGTQGRPPWVLGDGW